MDANVSFDSDSAGYLVRAHATTSASDLDDPMSDIAISITDTQAATEIRLFFTDPRALNRITLSPPKDQLDEAPLKHFSSPRKQARAVGVLFALDLDVASARCSAGKLGL
ncbi:hypothetical protein CDV31_001823 [Fusarium ambrosium]|uniref:Uncharacterized protein n=1 Tax=Fusarium ambrosium TaxID=131363 RepID=A0A428UYM4_9HYPO|nr:hypothetical protein CDV31_001823 [Fusarium ambrosium]